MSFLPAGVYVIEHKTTSEAIGLGSTYWKRLVLDGQASTYDGVAKVIYDEVRGIIYDVVKKPTIRPLKATPPEARKYTEPKSRACKECKKKAPVPLPHVETVERDGVACEVSCVDGRIVTDPGGRLYANLRAEDETPEEYRTRLLEDIASNPEAYYQRGEVVRMAEEEREHAADVWSVAEQIRESQRSGRWPRNPDACDQYGSFCTYWPVCAKEASIDDPLFYRDAGTHEELEGAKVNEVTDPKRRLPLVTASSLKSYRSCARKYYFAYELRRRSAHTSDALRFGTLMHKGLEAWWKTASLDAALDAMAGESDPFDRVRAECLMFGYHARWLDEPFEVLGVETEFVTPLVNPDTRRASRTWARGGKMDALARVS